MLRYLDDWSLLHREFHLSRVVGFVQEFYLHRHEFFNVPSPEPVPLPFLLYYFGPRFSPLF